MADKLVRVAKTRERSVYFPDIRVYAHPMAINPEQVDSGFRNGDDEGRADVELTECEFFVVGDRDVDAVVKYLAENNPGKEVQVYELQKVSVCPAAEMVTKQVSKEGILPV
jgi:hypothetical protein